MEKHGNFGIGTFDKLDGEMVAFDGNFYQVTVDGKVHLVSDTATTPFAMVTFFKPEKTCFIQKKTGFTDLVSFLKENLPHLPNTICAVKVTGTFSYVKERSVPAQQNPYIPLTEVLQKQMIFEFQNIKGTMVGYYCSDFMKEINVSGFHFHFLREDKVAGGHILDCIWKMPWWKLML